MNHVELRREWGGKRVEGRVLFRGTVTPFARGRARESLSWLDDTKRWKLPRKCSAPDHKSSIVRGTSPAD